MGQMKHLRHVTVLAVLATGCASPADVPASPPRAVPATPPAEVIAADACPFEGCRLGGWTARESMPVYSAPGDATPTSTLPPGVAVTAVSGEVRASPRRATVTRVYSTDISAGINTGATVYALYPIGEGALAVWHDGRVKKGSLDLTLDYAEPLASHPLAWVWWVRVRFADGAHGWVKNPQGRFDGMDALG